jgi:hypothetical protein
MIEISTPKQELDLKGWNTFKEIYDSRRIAERVCRLVMGGKSISELNKRQKKILGRSLARMGAIIGWGELGYQIWMEEKNSSASDY